MDDPHAAVPSSGWRDLPAGSRVVVRRRLTGVDAAGKRWTDVIGVVLSAGEDGLRLRTDAPRDAGREVFVAADDVAAVKRIPPRRDRAAP